MHSDPMRSTSIHPMLLTVLLLASFLAARADDLSEEVFNRCMSEVGELGNAMVQSCVEQDASAARALTTYPRDARAAIARCTERLKTRGWSMVKLCVDRDIEAAAALAAYGKEHAAAIERCQQQLAEQGAVKVKECVDREAGRGVRPQ